MIMNVEQKTVTCRRRYSDVSPKRMRTITETFVDVALTQTSFEPGNSPNTILDRYCYIIVLGCGTEWDIIVMIISREL
jgi:hypothetical protein